MHLQATATAIQINDLAVLSRPYWVYRDMTWQQVADYGGDSATGVIDQRLVSVQCRHEKRVYERASGVFVFSDWASHGVSAIAPSTRTVVVPPGVNAPSTRRSTPQGTPRLLFVGRAFERKGGRELLAAVALLRRRLDVRLDIVGPPPRSLGLARGSNISRVATSRADGKALRRGNVVRKPHISRHTALR